MAVTPTGMQGSVLTRARNMLAQSLTWQTICDVLAEASPATAAAGYIYLYAVEDVDITPPYIMLFPGGSRWGAKDTSGPRPLSGGINMVITLPIAEAHEDLFEDAYFTFDNTVSAILEEISTISMTGGYITDMTIEEDKDGPVWLSPVEGRGRGYKAIEQQFTINWG